MRQKNRFLRLSSFVVSAVLCLTAWMGTSQPARAQSATLRADAVVLVNSASAYYADYAAWVQPYLDQFGVPYAQVDVATSAVPADLAAYALIIIGHRQIDPSGAYLSASEQGWISDAVNQGTGLVNFDEALASSANVPYYAFVQTLFSFGYSAGSSSYSAAVNTSPSTGGYIVADQDAGASYTLLNPITPQGVSLPDDAAALLTLGGQPLLVARNYGLGRAVQWTSLEWMSATVWGPMRGWDDMVWRSLVWAARKPFVLQSMPPFVTFRVDDVVGPFSWLNTAAQYGWRPWAGIFLDEISDVPALKAASDAGYVTVAVHARTNWDWFYYDHAANANLSDAALAQNFSDASAWFSANQIPISTYIVPHFYEFGTNVFEELGAWGVEFSGTMIEPGTIYGSTCMTGGPYRLTVFDCESWHYKPFYYADTLTINGHPELDGQFFNVLTEIRADTEYEWAPDNDVSSTVERGIRQLRRALTGLDLATVFTHEYYLQSISASNWDAILSGMTTGLQGYQPEYVTLDYAAQYVRALNTSRIASSVVNASSGLLDTTLTGSTDLDTRFYLFTETDGVISKSAVSVPTFNGSTLVSVNADLPPVLPTATPTAQPTATTTSVPPTPTDTPEPLLTPTLTPTGPTVEPTVIPTLTPSAAPTATPTLATGTPITIDLTADEHQSPVLAATTDTFALISNDNLWTEFLWPSRGYAGDFAGTGETPPLMRYYASVPSGTYQFVANLYRNANLRYYWGYSAGSPQANSFDVTSGTVGSFTEFTLGTVTVENGLFEFYVNRADQLDGSGTYPYWGWSYIRLIPVSVPATSTPLPTATNTPLPTATETPLPTATETPSPTATETPLPTATEIPLPTATNTPLPTVTNTPLPTATETPLPTVTETPLPTATEIPLPTATEIPLPTATEIPLPTATNTPLPTATNTPLPTATETPLPTATETPLPTATETPLPTATETPLPTATETPLPTATNTPLPTATNTPLPTATETPLPTATETPLPTATETPLPTATETPLPTATETPLPTATETPLPTATNTPLPTATNTPLPTATETPLPTATETPLPTATETPLPTATSTPVPTPTLTPITIDLTADEHQSPVLTTTTDVFALTSDDNLWTEFLYPARGYAGIFADVDETPPLLRFYASVPSGTYTFVANLYRNADLRYYWGYTADAPQAYSIDVTSGTSGDFTEFTLGTVTVTDGLFEFYVVNGDILPDGGDYPFYGWSYVRLYPLTLLPTATPQPTATVTPPPTPTHTPNPAATSTPLPTATHTPLPPTPTVTPTLSEVRFYVANDANQSPLLTTTSNSLDLVDTDDLWTEYYLSNRGYAGVFASFNETPPLERFYAPVQNGTYTLYAGLYFNANLRYYWGYSASQPEAYSFLVQKGRRGSFSEYALGTVTVTNGVFELYIDRGDLVPGRGTYPFYGWAWIRLVPQS